MEKRRRDIRSTSQSFYFLPSVFLYIYLYKVRIARVLIKKKKKLLRRQEYAKFDHRGFHRKNVFSKNDTEIVTTVVGRWDGR